MSLHFPLPVTTLDVCVYTVSPAFSPEACLLSLDPWSFLECVVTTHTSSVPELATLCSYYYFVKRSEPAFTVGKGTKISQRIKKNKCILNTNEKIFPVVPFLLNNIHVKLIKSENSRRFLCIFGPPLAVCDSRPNGLNAQRPLGRTSHQ